MKIPKVKALVPMKDHSERVPRKNIRLLAGKPTFHWTIEALENSQYIDEKPIHIILFIESLFKIH